MGFHPLYQVCCGAWACLIYAVLTWWKAWWKLGLWTECYAVDVCTLAARGDLSLTENNGTIYYHQNFAVSGSQHGTHLHCWVLMHEQSLSLGQFCSRLKTELFNGAYFVV